MPLRANFFDLAYPSPLTTSRTQGQNFFASRLKDAVISVISDIQRLLVRIAKREIQTIQTDLIQSNTLLVIRVIILKEVQTFL